MGNDRVWIPIVFVALFVFGWYIGDGLMERKMRKQAIEYGYAKYDKTTGEWQWVPKPIEITDVGIVKDGVIEWDSDKKTKLEGKE